MIPRMGKIFLKLRMKFFFKRKLMFLEDFNFRMNIVIPIHIIRDKWYVFFCTIRGSLIFLNQCPNWGKNPYIVFTNRLILFIFVSIIFSLELRTCYRGRGLEESRFLCLFFLIEQEYAENPYKLVLF